MESGNNYQEQARGEPCHIRCDGGGCAINNDRCVAVETRATVRAGPRAEPPQPDDGRDLFDFKCGWQGHLCSFAESSFREHSVVPRTDESRQALLHSQ